MLCKHCSAGSKTSRGDHHQSGHNLTGSTKPDTVKKINSFPAKTSTPVYFRCSIMVLQVLTLVTGSCLKERKTMCLNPRANTLDSRMQERILSLSSHNQSGKKNEACQRANYYADEASKAEFS